MFEVPGLDTVPREQLPELVGVFRLLAGYCEHRRLALGWRDGGDWRLALNHEQMMDGLYKRLPPWAQWKGGA